MKKIIIIFAFCLLTATATAQVLQPRPGARISSASDLESQVLALKTEVKLLKEQLAEYAAVSAGPLYLKKTKYSAAAQELIDDFNEAYEEEAKIPIYLDKKTHVEVIVLDTKKDNSGSIWLKIEERDADFKKVIHWEKEVDLELIELLSLKPKRLE